MFDIRQLLIDAGQQFKEEERAYKGQKCQCFKLQHCIFNPSHTDNDACFFRYDSGKIVFKCLHDSCKDYGWEDAKTKLKEGYGLNLTEYWSNPTELPVVSQDKRKITYLSGAEIIAKPLEVDWIILGMIASGESILIHASGGIGKSTFVLFLALKLASPKSILDTFESGFLGSEFNIPRRRCSLILGAENGRVTTYQRLKKMCSGSSDLEEGLKRIFFLSQYEDTTITGEFFTDPSFCNFLVAHVRHIEKKENIKIDILVVDPLISFSGVKNENDSADIRPSLDALDNVCRQAGCTPIVIHHDRKDGDNYRGSTAINDWTRNRISLKREFIAENRITNQDAIGNITGQRVAQVPVIRVTHEKCNNFEMFAPFLVRMTRHLHFKRIDEHITPEDAERSNAVAQALKDMGGYAESTNALSKVYQELAGVSASTAKRHISMTVEHGVIQRKISTQKDTKSYEYFFDKQ